MRVACARLMGAMAGLAPAVALLFGASLVAAATHEVPADRGRLAEALASAAAGDRLLLDSGVHDGPITVGKPVSLEGRPGAIIDAEGAGSVVTVDAADVTIRGLEIRNSGTSLADENAGIFVTEAGDRARIESNRLHGNLIGVFLKGPANALVDGNIIVGRRDLRMNERGNGVHLWNTPGSEVLENEVRYGRDGIFVTTSRNNRFVGNRLRDLRFAVHYMYTQSSEVAENISRDNHAGYALMFSKDITVRGNISQSDRDHGILLNYVNNSVIRGNAVRTGGDKCLFIYNANKNEIEQNWFQGCGIGIHFTAGSENNRISGNAFIGNRVQVKYVGTRHLDWSRGGLGNFWSDNPAFDLDGNGIADRPYRPNDLVDGIIWAHPIAKLLLNSPALQVLRFTQEQFPALHPGGVVDSAPLMQPPEVNALRPDS